MEEAKVRPDAITFVGVICACLQTDKVREGDMYFKYMREHYGITPVVEHYTCMIELYSRANLMNALDELVKGMPRELSDDVAAAWIKSRLIDDIDDTENSLEHECEELQYWETRTEHLFPVSASGLQMGYCMQDSCAFLHVELQASHLLMFGVAAAQVSDVNTSLGLNSFNFMYYDEKTVLTWNLFI
ncbi:hypothetical protein NC653_007189 [Populus alba x Populus x berolinensis]|uniref:Pentatricopeptide repeat-containing protein n=1 Tax=Populus alba x Populus x berolinensis TaxID=444605 RepID=A0AAD6RHT1_9ROSI|nr:hypothetical protein NC653_007189 [Populus alba x Populus x berolinensis]